MSSHNLDSQPSERLFTEIDKLRREFSELRTLQKLGGSAVDAYTINISALSAGSGITVPANSRSYGGTSVGADANHVHIASLRQAWYIDSAVASNKLFVGNTVDNNYRCTVWLDVVNDYNVIDPIRVRWMIENYEVVEKTFYFQFEIPIISVKINA